MYKTKLSIFLLLIYLSTGVYSWKNLINGGMTEGNGEKPRTMKPQRSKKYVQEWFTQPLDHFNPADETTWQQRYFVNDEFFNITSGGLVFLILSGEAEASTHWMVKGGAMEYTKQFGGLLILLEHRYYGQSQPTQDVSIESLRFLTSQQALADSANFIRGINEKYKFPSSIKWIALGGSYTGALAAWVRFKYPHLVHGAIASSAPVLATVDFKDFYRGVTESLLTYGDNCVSTIARGVEQIDILMRETIGQQNLNKIFKLCDPIQDSVHNDITNFYRHVADGFGNVVQYNKDNRFNDTKGANITIDILCDIMVNQTLGTPVQRLGKVNELLLNANEEKCLDYKYENLINPLRNITWAGSSEGNRQWLYQSCTEFGFYQTSSYETHPFGNHLPIEFYVQQCTDIFGSTYDRDFLERAISHTNMFYGGLDIDVENVIFFHGSIDPWHRLGVTKTKNQRSFAMYIEGLAHCAHMYPSSDRDVPQLVEVRKKIGEIIASWRNA